MSNYLRRRKRPTRKVQSSPKLPDSTSRAEVRRAVKRVKKSSDEKNISGATKEEQT